MSVEPVTRRFHARRALALAAVLALGLATAIGSGGGGGGDGGGGASDEPAPPFPSVVAYVAGNPTDFGGSGADIALAGGGAVHIGFYLEGSYAKGTRAYTLTPHNVPRINLTTSGLPYALLFADFGILVEQTVQWTRGAHPTAGQVRTVPGGTVRLTVTADAGGTGQPGVDIAWIDAGATLGSASLTWAQIETVLSDPQAWQRFVVQAAFVYQVLLWVYDQIQIGLDGTEFVTLNDAALTQAGNGVGIDHMCDPFPLAATAGDFRFTWNDGPGEFAAALGAGDHFSVAPHDCWVDEPGPADLWLRSGTANLVNYWEDPATVTLGFTNVVLTGMVQTATRQTGAGHATLGTVTASSFGLSGENGFFLLTRPELTGGINLVNAMEVASAAASSLLLPRTVGDLGLGLLAGLVADASFRFCDISGSVGVVPAPTAGSAVPASFAVTFSACRRDPADPVTLDGTATLAVESVSGGTLAPLATDDHTATLAVDPIDVTSTDALGATVLTGGTRFTRVAVAGDFAESSQSLPGGLANAEAGVTLLLQSYQVASTLAAGGAFGLGAAGDTMAIVPDNLATALTVTVVQPVQGTDITAPASGVLRVEALDGSTLTLTVTNGIVRLELDNDGDGTVDDTLMTTWADLA